MENKPLKITHEGILKIAQFEIPCYVTENEARVLSGRGVQSVLNLTDDTGSKQKPGSRLQRLLNYKPLKLLIENKLSLDHLTPIKCINKGRKINGYDATMLIDICDIIIEMKNTGINLTDRQKIIAKQAEIIIRSVAKVGIVALIDEATGYQEIRDKRALEKILEAYINKELMKWQKRFPDEWYENLFRIRGIEWKNGTDRPSYIGRITNDIIYDRLPKGVLTELKKLNPPNEETGRRKYKHHQFLTPNIGHPKLQEIITGTNTLMKISPNWRKFYSLLQRAFPKHGDPLELDLDLE